MSLRRPHEIARDMDGIRENLTETTSTGMDVLSTLSSFKVALSNLPDPSGDQYHGGSIQDASDAGFKLISPLVTEVESIEDELNAVHATINDPMSAVSPSIAPSVESAAGHAHQAKHALSSCLRQYDELHELGDALSNNPQSNRKVNRLETVVEQFEENIEEAKQELAKAVVACPSKEQFDSATM